MSESKTMFKSRIPLQTPILVKLLLFGSLVAFFAGWSASSETSTRGFTPAQKIVAVTQGD